MGCSPVRFWMLTLGIALFSFAVLFAKPAIGLGISPAEIRLEFTPLGSEEIEYQVFNNERTSLSAAVEILGDMKDHARAEPATVRFDEGQYVAGFIVYIDLPQDLAAEPDLTVKLTELGHATAGPDNSTLSIESTIHISDDIPDRDIMVFGTSTAHAISTLEGAAHEHSAFAWTISLLILAIILLSILSMKMHDKRYGEKAIKAVPIQHAASQNNIPPSVEPASPEKKSNIEESRTPPQATGYDNGLKTPASYLGGWVLGHAAIPTASGGVCHHKSWPQAEDTPETGSEKQELVDDDTKKHQNDFSSELSSLKDLLRE